MTMPPASDAPRFQKSEQWEQNDATPADRPATRTGISTSSATGDRHGSVAHVYAAGLDAPQFQKSEEWGQKDATLTGGGRVAMDDIVPAGGVFPSGTVSVGGAFSAWVTVCAWPAASWGKTARQRSKG